MVISKLVNDVLNFKIALLQKPGNVTYLVFPLWPSYIIRQILGTAGLKRAEVKYYYNVLDIKEMA